MRNKRGITLIALVITIIILLILAGITITGLKNSGLFEKVQLAKDKSEQAQEKENAILGDYESKIGKYINGTRNENENNYSTDEQVVGKWIDGKKIYRKVVPVVITGHTPHGISDIDVLVKYSLTWYDTIDNAWYDRMRFSEDSYGIALEVYIDSTTIGIGSSKHNTIDWTNRTTKAYAILEYTKTTD